MKNQSNTPSTPKLNGSNGAHVNGQHDGTAQRPKVVSVADLIQKAKEENPDAIKEPTTYPAAVAPEQSEATAPEVPTTKATAAPEPTAPATTPNVTPPTAPARSRAEEIQYWNEKVRRMNLINGQLNSLTTKRDQLKDFSFDVEENEDHRYGRIVIYDDNNRPFEAKNHGLAAFVVEQLKVVFAQKIEQKEVELLTVANRE